MNVPYQTATSGEKALADVQRILANFGCTTFGTMIDTERGVTMLQFTWRGRRVSLEASWHGYAAAWLKANPYSYRSRSTREEHEKKAQEQARISVCSVLRDWAKAQITAVECGVMSFEAAFMPHMLLGSGERLIDRVTSDHLLPPPGDA